MFFTAWRRSSNTATPPSSKARPNPVGSTPCGDCGRATARQWCVSNSAIDLEIAGLGGVERAAAFLMLPGLYDRHQDMKVV